MATPTISGKNSPNVLQVENDFPGPMTVVSRSQSEIASVLMQKEEENSFGVISTTNELETQRIQRDVEDKLIENLIKEDKSKVFDLSAIIPFVKEAVQTLVQDDFSKCFLSTKPDPWNWNLYLYPLWAFGVLFRYIILLPIRMLILIGGLIISIAAFAVASVILSGKTRDKYQRFLIRFMCSIFVASWTGVVRYHGVIPARKMNQIYVSNHSSMIDLIILQQMNTFAAVGQQHKGWVAFLQNKVLACLGCIWFDRASMTDKTETARRLRSHISNPDSNRLLIFPEGTCVNNEYCVQFKKGAFELGAEVCPIAMKYNKIFVDGYWNSREQSFAMHLLTLMKSWAVVCDVYYLEPQTIQPNETSLQFCSRVKAMISERAGLKNVEFDGYLKHFKPSQRYVEEKQKLFAQNLIKKYPQIGKEAHDSKKSK